MSGVLINGNRLGRLHRDILAYLTWFVGRCFARQYEAYLFSAIYTFVYI